MNRSSIVLWLACLPGPLVLLGCEGAVVDGPHCSQLDGDATCAALGGQLPYCSAGCVLSPHGNGCVSERPADDCYSPCGGGLTADQLDVCPMGTSSSPTEPTASSGGGATMSTGESSVDGTETDTAAECATNDHCAAPEAFCEGGQCVGCDATEAPNDACAVLDPAQPLCVDGSCVACTKEDESACADATPICDFETNTCVGCTRHEQCPASACHQEVGVCLPFDRVWRVDGDAPACAEADGSERSPYCTIAEAMANIGAGEEGTLWLSPREDGLPYSESLTISAARVVAVRAEDGERPRVAGTGVGSPITVSGGAVAYLDHGRVDGSVGAEAISVVGGVLHLQRWLVVLNSGGGIALSNGAELRADTSVIGANGSALVDAQALRSTDSDFVLRYVTVAGNDSAGVASILCTGTTSGTVRNSIVVGLDPSSIDCPGLNASASAVDSLVEGDDLVLLDSFDAGWFVAPGAGDFHVALGHPFGDIARWQPGDPPVDIDGDLRPLMIDAPDVAGADR